MGEGEGGVPGLGEGGVFGAALGVGRAVDAEQVGGEARVAGAAQRIEKGVVLERLAAGEATGHPDLTAFEILLVKGSHRSSTSMREDAKREGFALGRVMR